MSNRMQCVFCLSIPTSKNFPYYLRLHNFFIEPSNIRNLFVELRESLNSSFKDALLTWEKPEQINGIIQKYIVCNKFAS